jgi:SAM-dependent methyltransferase
MKCLLCLSPSPSLCFQKKSGATYDHCQNCDLVFLQEKFHLSAEGERQRYETHQNDVTDPRYQNFVQPLVDAIQTRLAAGAEGLDYGCGPGPVAGYLLEKAGYEITYYDPYFRPHPPTEGKFFDFIILSEVAEHFRNPGLEWPRLRRFLKPGGVIAVLTALRPEQQAFASWSYHRDPTHVSFYSLNTFKWISEEYDFSSSERAGERLILLTAPSLVSH